MVISLIIVHILMMVHEWSIVLSLRLMYVYIYIFTYIHIYLYNNKLSYYKQLIGRIPCKISHYATELMLMYALFFFSSPNYISQNIAKGF